MHYNTRKLALSGLFLALIIITLFFATTLPVNKLSLFALSSFFISVIIIEFGVGAGWVFYIASCLLALILPNKLALVPYFLFFGFYGLLKYHIERINGIVVEYILKLIYFNLFIAVIVSFLKGSFLDTYTKFPFWAIIIGFEIAFIIYDYVYTLVIQYYKIKLKRILKL